MHHRSGSYGERGEKIIDRLLAARRRAQVWPHVPDGGRAVDLGCGYSGDLLLRLAPRLRQGLGFDLSVQETRPAPNIRLEPMPADSPLPLANASVDLVTCLAVIEHVDRPDILVREARRVLRPGGTLVVTTPSKLAKPVLEHVLARFGVIDPEEILDHKRYFTPTTLRATIEAGGFPHEEITIRRFELGLNLAAVARV
jgi:SAM-dependent methyltransferase